MNPPAAIQNAMARERKPFTYTPGGLDLSEIKSERMARRLMRNAMNQGVPEVTSPSAQSPTTHAPSFPQAAHYMNLPVQVFPAFQLPANPKSLLRTRSQPHQSESFVDRNQASKEKCVFINGNRTSPVTELTHLQQNNSKEHSATGVELLLHPRLSTSSTPQDCVTSQISAIADCMTSQALSPTVQSPSLLEERWFDCSDKPTPNITVEPCLRMPSQILQSNTEDKKVKLKKKTTPKEAASDENMEVEATIKVTKPKKTISTAVEIERKILPNGKVEETKTTTTNTIINGKIEDSKVQKETRILSDEEAKAVIEEESEEEEEEVEEQEEIKESSQKSSVQQNGIAKEVITETKTETKKSVNGSEEHVITEVKEINQIEKKKTDESGDEEDEEEVNISEKEDEIEEEEVVIIKPKPQEQLEVKAAKDQSDEDEEEEEEEEEEVVEEKIVKEKEMEQIITKSEQLNGNHDSEEEEEEEEEEEDEKEEKVIKKEEVKESEPEESEPTSPVPAAKAKISDAEESEEDEEEEEEEVLEETKEVQQKSEKRSKTPEVEKAGVQEEVKIKTDTTDIKTDSTCLPQTPEETTTSKTETTEITSSISNETYDRPISTQTELHRTENVTVTNRTTKMLDNTYEQLTQHGVPTVRTYFAPPNRERISTSPQPSKPYTPTFTLERKQPERRHSLLLDRLSMERQVAPPESYHNAHNYQSNQNYEQVTNQWSQEPQSEVVNASNVKPSSINNSQWYTPQSQQPQSNSNVIYNNVQPTTPIAQPSYQKPSYDSAPYAPPAYQPQAPSYTPTPSSWGSNNLGNLDRLPSINAQSNQYSFMSTKSTTENYSQQSTGAQQYSTGYVPPPWENNQSVTYQTSPSPFYQSQTATPASTPTVKPSWSTTPQPSKYSKAPPLSYQPPAPNQSFVKKGAPGHNSEPGRKTYYSEYERRYISVPESTYIPTETKVQPQWDASPQYYYDNAEPTEEVEQPWRKELREFTEKSTKVEETTIIQPPWTEESNYSKSAAFSPQPKYQTTRPRSWRERSYDESMQQQSAQEWSKTSTLDRRPVSAFVKTHLDSPSYDRARGVSVDRYNVNSYQSPASYAPASNNVYTLPWEIQEQPTQPPQKYSEKQQPNASQPSKTYHNPQVPAYHIRPTESRDYQVNFQPRWSGMGRECPVQSRSFKYLQMLTGTEDGVEQPEPFVIQQPHHSAPRPRRV